MNIDALLEENLDFFNLRIKTQYKIMSINEENIDKLILFLEKKKVFSDQILCRFLLSSIATAFQTRHESFNAIIELMKNIGEKILIFFDSDDLFYNFFTTNLVRLGLYRIGLINISSILKLKDIENLSFFAPEIKEHLDEYMSNLKQIDREKLEKALQKKRAESLVFSDDLFAKIIETDDVVEFQNHLSQTNAGVNYTLQTTDNAEYYLPSKSPALIEYAMFFRSKEIFKYLFNNGAKLSQDYAAVYAIAGGDYDIIHIIAQKDPNLFSTAALRSAIRYHHYEIIDYLHENLEIPYDFECLYTSIVYNNFKTFYETVSLLKTNPNARSMNSEASLYTCVNFGRFEMFKFISQIDGINLNARSIGVKWTPLHLAASYNNLEIIKYLFSLAEKIGYTDQEIDSSDSDSLDHFGWGDITINDDKKISKGLNVNSKAKGMYTPLHLAILSNDIETIKLFLSNKKVNVNAKNSRGLTPVHLAANSNLEIFKLICEREDANYDAVSYDGETPLKISIKNNKEDITNYILQLKKKND